MAHPKSNSLISPFVLVAIILCVPSLAFTCPDCWVGGGKTYPTLSFSFVRLEHKGYNWNDGMGKTEADVNFLREFKEVTELKDVGEKGESISIADLKGKSIGELPFVFLTGDGPIRGVGGSDIKILREYCEKGGMLIADAGSAAFDQSFRDLMNKIFPGKSLLNVADDDQLYQLPFNFPNGAPSFWSHGGTKGMGIKQKNRWMVYYHPGDMNDAWKSSGYSKVTPEMRKNALNLGVNLAYHAILHSMSKMKHTPKNTQPEDTGVLSVQNEPKSPHELKLDPTDPSNFYVDGEY